MTGKNRTQSAAPEVSTGGSLISDAKLRQLYTAMVHSRLLTEFAMGSRFKARSVSPYRLSMGQEATVAGWVTDLQPDDTIALAPGDAIAALIKGVPLPELMKQLLAGGGEAPYPANNGHNVIPSSLPLEEQFGAITATAFANKRKKKRPVVVAFASTPTMAFEPWVQMVAKAVRQKLPIVFVIENNPWTAPPTAGETTDEFTRKARGYGLTGISVDGNDVVAVYRVAYESLDRVRQGDGPVMVESATYSESGRAKRKRVERDPLVHMERYLKAKKLFASKWKDELVEEFTRELKRTAKAARKQPHMEGGPFKPLLA